LFLENGIRHFRLMRWGPVARLGQGRQEVSPAEHARAETVLEKPAFKNAIKRRRLLIPGRWLL